jgi:hypothetical protein
MFDSNLLATYPASKLKQQLKKNRGQKTPVFYSDTIRIKRTAKKLRFALFLASLIYFLAGGRVLKLSNHALSSTLPPEPPSL